MTIDTLVLGLLETNCYVVRDGADCWVVDPGLDAGPLMRFLADSGASVSRIILTHGHGDHIAGVNDVKAAHPSAVITCPAGDADMLTDPRANLSAPFGFAVSCPPADETVAPGDVLALGASRWDVLDTSGHTPGGVSLYCAEQAVVITGDALFAGSIGRTDIPRGSASRLLRHIRENLLTLPDETAVLPGHGPRSTIGAEKRTNPFFAGE
jgi:glyoxylase-like metal-dependent hydrolase (beta-lactamase superfamily II)